MNTLKFIIAASALVMFAQPALAQDSAMDHSKMDHGQMDHSKMDHGNHDHAGMKAPDLSNDAIAEDAVIVVAKVNGLVCDFCAQALKKVFKKEDAVESLNVDLSAGEVLIALRPGQSLSDERVKKLIRKSGYSLVSTERVISR